MSCVLNTAPALLQTNRVLDKAAGSDTGAAGKIVLDDVGVDAAAQADAYPRVPAWRFEASSVAAAGVGQHEGEANSGGKCVDFSSRCARWVKEGLCAAEGDKGLFAREVCGLSCKACEKDAGDAAGEDGDDEAVCADTHDECGPWSKRGFCTSGEHEFALFMHDHCRKSCFACRAASAHPPRPTTAPTPPPTAPPGEQCLDAESSCVQWSEWGWCEHGHAHMEYMRLSCRVSCGHCKTDP